jgi:hypothetical protein
MGGIETSRGAQPPARLCQPCRLSSMRTSEMSPPRGWKGGGLGLMALSVDDKGPGAAAGVKQGDVILAWSGETLRGVHHLRRSTQTEWPDERNRSCDGRPGPKASAAILIGNRSRGLRCAQQFTFRWPSHLTGRNAPEPVTMRSPTLRVSTGTSPRGVRMTVPSTKQGSVDVRLLLKKGDPTKLGENEPRVSSRKNRLSGGKPVYVN